MKKVKQTSANMIKIILLSSLLILISFSSCKKKTTTPAAEPAPVVTPPVVTATVSVDMAVTDYTMRPIVVSPSDVFKAVLFTNNIAVDSVILPLKTFNPNPMNMCDFTQYNIVRKIYTVQKGVTNVLKVTQNNVVKMSFSFNYYTTAGLHAAPDYSDPDTGLSNLCLDEFGNSTMLIFK